MEITISKKIFFFKLNIKNNFITIAIGQSKVLLFELNGVMKMEKK